MGLYSGSLYESYYLNQVPTLRFNTALDKDPLNCKTARVLRAFGGSGKPATPAPSCATSSKNALADDSVDDDTGNL